MFRIPSIFSSIAWALSWGVGSTLGLGGTVGLLVLTAAGTAILGLLGRGEVRRVGIGGRAIVGLEGCGLGGETVGGLRGTGAMGLTRLGSGALAAGTGVGLGEAEVGDAL